jgi:exodeoxyribonuclease-3
MKVTTWNVNSVRMRIDHVTNWLQANPVDVLCLQETKVVAEEFPRSPFADIGYEAHVLGQKSYNGVALLTQNPLQDVQMGFTPVLEAAGKDTASAQLFDQQKRVISALTDSGVRITNLYVPNGNSIGSEKYEYKLGWFEVLQSYVESLLTQSPQGILICGDFNIALEDRDIHDPTQRDKHIMASDQEREALKNLLSLGFADAFRKFNQEEGQFSWWDYRAGSFSRNRGWRIDHHYLTPDLYEQAIACTIDPEPRKLEKPSDHTPVTVEIALN